MKNLSAKFIAIAIVGCSALVLPEAAAQEVKPVVMDSVVVNADRTYTLFEGVNISVALDKSLYPVRDVFGSSWVIGINGEDQVVSAKRAPVNLKIATAMKLTESSATITGLKKEQGYTFENDPSVRLTRSLSQSGLDNIGAQTAASAAQHVADTMANPAIAAYAASDNSLSAAQQVQDATYQNPKVHPTNGNNPNENSVQLTQRLVDQAAVVATNRAANGDEVGSRVTTTMGYDAMEIDFSISSPRRFQNPYIVTMTEFHPDGSPPGTVQRLVFAKALDPIDFHPTHVHFEEGGFPIRFDLIDIQIHLYNRGVEIATNISPKHVEMSRDEAFDFVKKGYLKAHKNDTLPAVPVMGKIPDDLATRLAAGKYGATFFVRVSKDGLAREAFADAECTNKIADPYLDSLVSGIRFKPALEQGKPIDGVASLNLNKLSI